MATKAPIRPTRPKISTTVSPETLDYLEGLVAKGEAHNISDAIDLMVERLRSAENRERLEQDTAAYFDRLSPEAVAEETELGTALSRGARGIDFDREP
jgi:Arc/MetJ-type ribon-helix-helix transcriptional regulator